jgi:hypothetical protein
MRRLVYQVYVGPRSELYDFCTSSVQDYCEAHGFAHIVQTEPILRIEPDPATSGRSMGASRLGYLPIFEKENSFAYLETFDQVAVIDADVWARPGAPSIFAELEPGDDFAACVERDMPLTSRYRQKIRKYSSQQYRPLTDVDWRWDDDGAEFCNMGVMVFTRGLLQFLDGQTPTEFLHRGEFARFVDGLGFWKWSTDQTLLNWWLRSRRAVVRHLDWRWNALYAATLPGHCERAHFVHFFLRDHLPNKGENVEELVACL